MDLADFMTMTRQLGTKHQDILRRWSTARINNRAVSAHVPVMFWQASGAGAGGGRDGPGSVSTQYAMGDGRRAPRGVPILKEGNADERSRYCWFLLLQEMNSGEGRPRRSAVPPTTSSSEPGGADRSTEACQPWPSRLARRSLQVRCA